MENLHVCPVAMVTGATQYTGFATAKLFAQRGYDVCVTSRDYAKAENAAQRLRWSRRQSSCPYRWIRLTWKKLQPPSKG